MNHISHSMQEETTAPGPRTITLSRYQSPMGEMILGSWGDRLCICDWADGKRRETIYRRIGRHLGAEYRHDTPTPVIELTVSQLEEYFSGRRRDFDIPVVLAGTDFQRAVWTELMKVPYGNTVSYSALARRIGNPDATRAVASANAANPLCIIVPCHRVIGSYNTLTGYRGGLEVKRRLLVLEGLICLTSRQGTLPLL